MKMGQKCKEEEWYECGLSLGSLFREAYKSGGLKLKAEEDLYTYEFFAGFLSTEESNYEVDSEVLYNNMEGIGIWLFGMISAAFTEKDNW